MPMPISLAQLNEVQRLKPSSTNLKVSFNHWNTYSNHSFHKLPIFFTSGSNSMHYSGLALYPPHHQDHSACIYCPCTLSISGATVQEDYPITSLTRFCLEHPKLLLSQRASQYTIGLLPDNSMTLKPKHHPSIWHNILQSPSFFLVKVRSHQNAISIQIANTPVHHGSEMIGIFPNSSNTNTVYLTAP